MGALQPWHLIIVLIVVLIVFGAGKLADVGGALGKSVKEFKQSVHEGEDGQPSTLTAPTTGAVHGPVTNGSAAAGSVASGSAATVGRRPDLPGSRPDDI